VREQEDAIKAGKGERKIEEDGVDGEGGKKL